MAAPMSPHTELIEAISSFAAAVKEFKGGDHAEHLRLLKQADKLRFLLETPMDVLMKQ
jgi:high-affinity K+ transport system ATPase subunit B